MLALALAAADARWVPLGVSESGLRLFVERASVRRSGARVVATVRMGSPRTITGRIVLVYQVEEFDCAGRRWRMTAFDARDADGKTVTRRELDGPMLPADPGTIADRALQTVCIMAKSAVAPLGSER